jgi:2-alkenal reductase
MFRHLRGGLGILGMLAVLALGYGLGWNSHEGLAAQSGYRLNESEKLLATLYHQVGPSVVSISQVDPLFGEISGGSGFVIDRQGYILTNAHVVELEVADAGLFLVVTFLDGTHTRGEIVGIDEDSDLAVLRVNIAAEQLRPVTFANSEDLLIGQQALAIGSPFGQRWTLTAGIISALDRTIEGLNDYQIGAVVQTDAAINPGNSGGPLLNMRGEVIGINAQIISENRANSGVGFAIPSNLAQRVARDLVGTGSVEYAYLGVQNVADVNLRLIERLGLNSDQRGVAVGGVSGPAQLAGLQADDIITAIDGRQISGLGTLLAYLATYTAPGQTVDLSVLRRGETIAVPVELGTR